jgi:hypothetical protein
MTDKKTRILLIAIAGGLWANVMVSSIKPAHADDDTDAAIQQMASDISDMQGDINALANGTCTNGRLCN